MLEPGANAGERALEIIHHLVGLRLDPLRQRQRIIVRIGRELTSYKQPAIRFDHMAIRGHRLWRIRDQMVYRCSHDRSPYWDLLLGAVRWSRELASGHRHRGATTEERCALIRATPHAG